MKVVFEEGWSLVRGKGKHERGGFRKGGHEPIWPGGKALSCTLKPGQTIPPRTTLTGWSHKLWSQSRGVDMHKN